MVSSNILIMEKKTRHKMHKINHIIYIYKHMLVFSVKIML
jgi:hypothetical protein